MLASETGAAKVEAVMVISSKVGCLFAGFELNLDSLQLFVID